MTRSKKRMLHHNTRKKRFSYIFLLLAVLMAALLSPVPSAVADGKKNVLILNSYHQGYKWTDDETRGAMEALAPIKDDLKIYIEYMGTKWASDDQYFEQLHRVMKYKYRSVGFDAIILSDNDALNFLVRYRDDIFGRVPTVFCGINYFTDGDLKGQPLYTGINETADVKGTLEIALRLHPSTQKVIVINDTTTTGRILHDELVKIIPAFQNKVRFEFLEDIEMGKLLERVENLSSDSLIFYTLFFRDKTGKFYEYDESILLISQRAKVPIYAAWDFSLGYGIIGGMLTSGYDQGRAAGEMAFRILQGEKSENISVVRQSPTRYMFDYRQMGHYGIKRSDLPHGSVIINEPKSFYEIHKGFVWGAFSSVAVLIFIIMVLLINIHRRKEAEKSLQKARDELETRVEERTADLVKTNYLLVNEIADRKQAEEALKESGQELQSIIQGSPIPTFVIGSDHKVIYWNKALGELSGIKAEEVIGTDRHWRAFYRTERPCMADLLVDEKFTEIFSLYQDRSSISKLLEGAYEATDFFPELGNHGKWLRFTAADIKNSQGNLVGAIETLEDITERKEAEEALTSEHDRLASILDGIPIPNFVIDRKHRLVLWNRHSEIYTGVAREELMGKPLDLSFLFPDKSPPLLAELILEMRDEELMANFGKKGLRKSKIQPHTFESIGRIWLRGEERTLNIHAARIFDFKGELVGAIQTAQDITERMQLELQLRQTQKMETIGTLAGGIAHDFNNILSAIMGYTDMALTDQKMDDRLRRYLGQVFKAGERARDLVKQILAFSRQSDEKPRPLRVSPIIEEVLKLLRASLPTTIQICQNIQADPDMVLADPTHIHQILMNLCTNAAHAMRETKGELNVTLFPVEISSRDPLIAHHGLTPGMYLELTVSDTGIGIDPDIMERIFDPFFTTKKPGEGTGMGLSVVYGIIKSYGGTITVQSEVGKGSKFHVYLPLLMETEVTQEAQPEAHITGGKERILFVDDEDVLVQLGKHTLSSLGYEVIGKTDSLGALELFRTQPDRFDLVITDMTMPNMTGVELAQELMRIRPNIPVILCTGFSEAITPEVVKAIGVKDFILKPVIRSQIASAIRQALNQKK